MKTKFKNRNKSSQQDLTRDISIIYAVLFVALMFASPRLLYADISNSQANKQEQASFPTLFAVGRGELTWFGLSIYRASLWTRDGEFKNLNESIPVALTINYEKNITAKALVKRTLEEWQHLGVFSEADRIMWGNKLEKIWPDVKSGDNITTLVDENRKTHFFHNGSLLKTVDDPQFGTSLLSIWLDPETSEPELRATLIGQQES